MNTWSVSGFLSEGSQPAELGWGTHEKHWPEDARQHLNGSQCAIYLERRLVLASSIASPYLGKISGYYTDWTPLKQRETLFKEKFDYTDPWQFLNIRVE